MTLLEHGLVSIHDFSASESRYSSQFYAAERSARDAKKGLWKDYAEQEQAEEAAAAAAATVQNEPRREYIDIVVSEIVSGTRFYVQVVNDEIRQLEKLMAELSHYHSSRAGMESAYKPKVGDLVSAKFTEDDAWYRAKVRRVSQQGVADVLYIDYGNVRYQSHRSP